MKTPFLQRPWMVALLATVACLFWGSAFPCIKLGYGLFGIGSEATFSQMLFAGCRFFLAGLLAVGIGSVSLRTCLIPQKTSWLSIAKLCMFQTVLQYIFFYIGLAHTTGVKASIVGGTNVFLSILLASLLFRQEHLNSAKIVGCVLGFVGLVLVNLQGNRLEFSFSLLGEGFIFFSTIASAFSAIYIKKFSALEHPVALSGYQFMLGGVVLAVVGLLGGGRIVPQSPSAYGMLLYLALISAVAFSLWGLLLKHNPVSKVTVYSCLIPVFGTLLSSLFLAEGGFGGLGWQTLVALLLISLGVYIVNQQKL